MLARQYPTHGGPSWFDTGVVRDPVHFPALAAVSRKKLLEMTGVGTDRGDHETDQDGTPVEGFLVDELAAETVRARHNTPNFACMGLTPAIRELLQPSLLQ